MHRDFDGLSTWSSARIVTIRDNSLLFERNQAPSKGGLIVWQVQDSMLRSASSNMPEAREPKRRGA